MASNVDTVKLFYLGGFTNPKSFVTSKGTAYAVPPIGKFIEVPNYVAKDIIRRNRNPQGFSVFTTSEVQARQAALSEQARMNPSEPRKMTKEELLAELAKLNEQLDEADISFAEPTKQRKSKAAVEAAS